MSNNKLNCLSRTVLSSGNMVKNKAIWQRYGGEQANAQASLYLIF